MITKVHLRNTLLLLIVVGVGYVLLRDWIPQNGEAADAEIQITPATRLMVSYFAQGKNCVTCEKLPLLTRQGLEMHFKEQLDAGIIVWRAVNVDAPSNEHYIEEYTLYTKSVVLSRMADGKEVAWKNLEKIWDLVGDDEAFIAYIQAEVNAMLDAPS